MNQNQSKILLKAYKSALLIVLLVVSIYATNRTGYLVGWLVGASRSPVVVGVAPLILSLLAVLGIDAGLRRTITRRRSTIWRAIFVAGMVFVFCYSCTIGVGWGILSRTEPYKSMDALIGSAWESTDDRTATALHRFRWRARQSHISRQEFEDFMEDVIRPILNRDDAERSQKVVDAITLMEEALPSQTPISAKAD